MRQVGRPINAVSDQCKMLKLFIRKPFRMCEILDIDDVGLQKLVHGFSSIPIVHNRCNGPPFDGRERVRQETHSAKLLVDVTEAGLILIQRHKRYLDVDRNGLRKFGAATTKRHQFAPLDIDFEQVDILDLSDIIKASSLDSLLLNHSSPCCETVEH